MPQEEDRIRSIAGYLLKNNARLILSASPGAAAFTKVSVLQSFGDPSLLVRNAAGQAVVALLGVLEPKNWPECLEQLVSTLDSGDVDRQEVSFTLPCSDFLGFESGCYRYTDHTPLKRHASCLSKWGWLCAGDIFDRSVTFVQERTAR